MALVSKSSPTAICMLEDYTFHSLCMAWLYLYPFLRETPCNLQMFEIVAIRSFGRMERRSDAWPWSLSLCQWRLSWRGVARGSSDYLLSPMHGSAPRTLGRQGRYHGAAYFHGADGSVSRRVFRPAKFATNEESYCWDTFETPCKTKSRKKKYTCIIYHMIICQSMDSWRLIGTKMQARTTLNTLPFDV